MAELRRSSRDRVVLGVCGGAGERLGVDPVLLRLAVAATAFAGGVGVIAYGLAALAIPAAPGPVQGRRLQQAAGAAALAAIAVVLGARLPGAVPTVLLLAGLALILRQALGGSSGSARALGGVALLAGGAAVFVAQQGSLTAAASAAVAGAVAAGGVALLVSPRLTQARAAAEGERLERVRADERAAVAAQLHDSVLQTLALVQTTADPAQARALARRQERELRAWLYGGEDVAGAPVTFAAALRRAADETEQAYGIEVALVQPSDAPLDADLEALVAAAREAMTNAGKHAGQTELDVLARVSDREASVFVRDRGPGFDRAAVSTDRRGLADSIEARMARHGGRATIHTSPGAGTEVELILPRT